MIAAITAAISFSAGIGTPWTISGSTSAGSWSPPGMPAKIIVLVPRIIAPRPMVTMIREITGRVSKRRTTIALKATPNIAMPAAAHRIAAANPKPIADCPTAVSVAPNHDPLAEREIDHARRFVDEHERERDQGIERAGQRAVDQQRQKKD